jgi:hypothetical protein
MTPPIHMMFGQNGGFGVLAVDYIRFCINQCCEDCKKANTKEGIISVHIYDWV